MLNLLNIETQSDLEHRISRRSFLGIGLLTAATAIVPPEVFSAFERRSEERIICLHNVYTKENIEMTYWRDGKYLPEGLAHINHLCRDARTGRVKPIKRELIDLLYGIQQKLKIEEPFHIISGYRSPRSNAILSKINKGVAKNSMHMYGKAADIRVPGYSLKGIRRAAMKLQAGGVGYYPRSKFVHVDVGNVRYWRG